MTSHVVSESPCVQQRDGSCVHDPSVRVLSRLRCTPHPAPLPLGAGGEQSGLEVNFLRYQFAMMGGITKGELRVFGAFEVEMHVVLPGEANAAMHLNAFTRCVAIGITAVRLGHRHG